jgi:hypothetical protein
MYCKSRGGVSLTCWTVKGGRLGSELVLVLGWCGADGGRGRSGSGSESESE